MLNLPSDGRFPKSSSYFLREDCAEQHDGQVLSHCSTELATRSRNDLFRDLLRGVGPDQRIRTSIP